jgi:hypothetical protein
MTVNARQPQLHVGIVRELNGLLCDGCHAPNCQPYSYPKRL